MHEIDLRRFDLNLLVVFDVLMAERSVTRAAARLARTQSAISHALARLREQVGDPLLVKVGGRMTASPRAEALAEEVRGALAGIRRMLAAPAPFDAATSTRTFRIAFPDLSMAWFAQLAAAVRERAPGVSLEWVRRDETTPLAVAEGRVDLALFPAAMKLPEGIDGEPAGAFSWATFARRGHPAARAWGRAAWRAWPHVAVRVSVDIASPVETAGRAADGRRIAAWVPHFGAVPPLLARTDLLATLPLVAMVEALETHDLIALAPPFPIAPMPHQLAWSRRLGGEPGLAWLRAQLREAFGRAVTAAEASGPAPKAGQRRH
jgi:DNA-binding transcriptional LysR family regulator